MELEEDRAIEVAQQKYAELVREVRQYTPDVSRNILIYCGAVGLRGRKLVHAARLAAEFADRTSLADIAEAKQYAPKASLAVFRKCLEAGFTGEELIHAAGCVSIYRTNFQSIITWRREDRMTLPEIERDLELADLYREHRVSVVSMREYRKQIGFTTDNAHFIMEAFQDAWNRDRKMFPAHSLLYIIEERFGGDVLRAYHIAVDDPDGFMEIVTGQTSLGTWAIKNARTLADDETANTADPDDRVIDNEYLPSRLPRKEDLTTFYKLAAEREVDLL